jgi:ribosome-binding protein aMBF1 (putative translation factor)
MPECRECNDEVDELFKVRVGKKTLKVCEDCADRIREELDIADEAEGAMQDMMGYKGRW